MAVEAWSPAPRPNPTVVKPPLGIFWAPTVYPVLFQALLTRVPQIFLLCFTMGRQGAHPQSPNRVMTIPVT